MQLLTAKLACLVALVAQLDLSSAVKHADFKTCSQSGFCKRGRDFADRVTAAGPAWTPEYELAKDTISLNDGVLTATVFKTIDEKDGGKVELPLKMSFLVNSVARVQLDEAKRQKGEIELRHDSKARKERYNEAEKFALVGGTNYDVHANILNSDEGSTKIRYGWDGQQVVIDYKPFKISFIRDGEVQAVFNQRNFLTMEHWRPKRELKEGEEATVDESTWWDESFGGNTDSKPRGPESIGLDITFPGYEHVYGIPEHASSLSLKETRGGEGNYEEPYRLYNADVFEYITDSPMTLYGSIPFMQAAKNGSTVGVFWLNSAETWVDVTKSKKNPASLSNEKRSTHTHWMSESGILDVFFLPGPNAGHVYEQYSDLTGTTTLPPQFSLGYHQCRWNYVSQDDVKDVDRNFDKFDMPYDVIWLDIEYTEDKKYFTWDPSNFKDPLSMQKQLDMRERKLVAIIDPHIKNDPNYAINKEMNSAGYAVKDKHGEKSFEGWCWPGSSNWVDGLNPNAVTWWKSLFDLKRFPTCSKNVHIWNDMNEPSVFNGPEITMPKDNLHYGNWEHRDVHNIVGMAFHNATYGGMIERDGPGNERRPFVLTRSFFAGSQRTAAMWTGDNQASWEHLAQAFPMILSQGIAGMPFAGADVGGFFGNPPPELFTRWYQSGAFYPFFRGHAHIDAKRREPYLVDEPYRSIVRDALRLRYQLLPVWYTAFQRASKDGMPVIRPHFVMFPNDPEGFAIDDQFFVGDSGLLVKPIVKEGQTETEVYLPDDEPYYDYQDYKVYKGKGWHKVQAPLEKIPLLLRGSHMVPRKDRHRRSAGLMKFDPYTLVFALNNEGKSGGLLYADDGETFSYTTGSYVRKSYSFDGRNIISRDFDVPDERIDPAFIDSMKDVRVEKIILVGVPDDWKDKKTVTVTDKEGEWKADLEFRKGEKGHANVATVRDPRAKVGGDWIIEL